MAGSDEARVAALDDLPSSQLRLAWRAQTRGPVPKISPALLRLALAWEIQASVHGGVPRGVTQTLDQLARGMTKTRPSHVGLRLAREWAGQMHVVMIGEDGVVRWSDREWRSLSEVARAITGTRWSGPAFFGLKRKVPR